MAQSRDAGEEAIHAGPRDDAAQSVSGSASGNHGTPGSGGCISARWDGDTMHALGYEPPSVRHHRPLLKPDGARRRSALAETGVAGSRAEVQRHVALVRHIDAIFSCRRDDAVDALGSFGALHNSMRAASNHFGLTAACASANPFARRVCGVSGGATNSCGCSARSWRSMAPAACSACCAKVRVPALPAAGAGSSSSALSCGRSCVGGAASFGGDALAAPAGRGGRAGRRAGARAGPAGGMNPLIVGRGGISCSQTRSSCSILVCTGRVAIQNSTRCSTIIAAMYGPWGRRTREKSCSCSARSMLICSTILVMKVAPVCKFATAL